MIFPSRLTYELNELQETVKRDESARTALLTENSVNELIGDLKAIKVASKNSNGEVSRVILLSE